MPSVVEVDVVHCGPGVAVGCYMAPPVNLILIQRGLDSTLHACVLAHEIKHSQGWTHAHGVPAFAADCGNGEMWLPTVEAK